jgi:poly(3-hydroxybutyrate) depolymerase
MLFDQGDSTLGSKGLIYVPDACKSQKCKLHVHFHGCAQHYDSLKNLYAKNAGFNKYAESNNIVVLYPQTKSSFFAPSNPNGLPKEILTFSVLGLVGLHKFGCIQQKWSSNESN